MDPSLKGENPEGLQSPTKFEMIVDMKTAKAVDLHVSPQFLARADRVID